LDQWLLGQRRAQAIVAELVARGVSPARLRAWGMARPPSGAGPGPELIIAERR
jgi:hypothetical protein